MTAAVGMVFGIPSLRLKGPYLAIATLGFGTATYQIFANVESLSGGTGARFSLLPPDNASGNFVKVVERVPVRIAWSAPQPRADSSGRMCGSTSPNQLFVHGAGGRPWAARHGP